MISGPGNRKFPPSTCRLKFRPQPKATISGNISMITQRLVQSIHPVMLFTSKSRRGQHHNDQPAACTQKACGTRGFPQAKQQQSTKNGNINRVNPICRFCPSTDQPPAKSPSWLVNPRWMTTAAASSTQHCPNFLEKPHHQGIQQVGDVAKQRPRRAVQRIHFLPASNIHRRQERRHRATHQHHQQHFPDGRA